MAPVRRGDREDQVRGRGIALTTLCPGFGCTAMTAQDKHPMPRRLDADEAARRMLRALARRRKVCNFPGQTNLLIKLVGWLLDWC